MSIRYLVYDIETVENAKAKELFANAPVDVDKRLRDPQKIEEHIREKRQRALETAALFWWTGRIVCICANPFGFDAEPVTFSGDDERELLSSFFDWATDHYDTAPFQIIGKSNDTFDNPYVVGRAMVHNIGIPSFLRPSGAIRDINHIFGFSSQTQQRTSLYNYAFGLGIKNKSMSGSDVAGLYARIMMGEPELWSTLRDYCANDVDIVSEMLRRWTNPYIIRSSYVRSNPPLDIPFNS